MSAPLVTPSRDALAKALDRADDKRQHGIGSGGYDMSDPLGYFLMLADALIASGAVIDAATLTDDETVRAVAYRFAEGEATYAASTVRHVLRALVDVLAERGEQHG